MAPLSPVPRPDSRASRLTTTTYHSIPEHASHRPGSSQPDKTATGSDTANKHEATLRKSRPSKREGADKQPTAFHMVRQDSGYESGPAASRTSSSAKRLRNPSKTSSSPSSSDRTLHRPSLRRSTASGPVSRFPGGRSSLTVNRPSFLTPQQQSNLARKNSYFQFPAPENLDQEDDQAPRQSVDLGPVILKVNTANLNPDAASHARDPSLSSSSQQHMTTATAPTAITTTWPPTSPAAAPAPTTHYWTSDRTRQLEYAAIDAASQGVRGWIMRNVVPDCLVPRNHRRAGFEDDGGSVRRYRIELEVECPEDSVPPSPVGEKLQGFRARGAARPGWLAKLRRG